MRTPKAAVVMLACLAMAMPSANSPAVPDAQPSEEGGCKWRGTAWTRTTLYFGLAHNAGTVTEREWQAFVHSEVTPRFPAGLTVWTANGQWRRSDGSIARERTKVLLLLHEATPEARIALRAIIASYKQAFHQQSVLTETAPVCAEF